MSEILPTDPTWPSQFVLSDAALEAGGPSETLQVIVEMAPERGWVNLKAHLIFWNTIAVCLRRVGSGDDTAITLARSLEAAMQTPNRLFKEAQDDE